MTTGPVYSIGDIIERIPSLPGQTVSATQFTIIATYYDAAGYWHAVESIDPSGRLVQTAMNDGGPYTKLVGHRAVPTPAPLPAPAPRPVDPSPPAPPQHSAPRRSWWRAIIDFFKGLL